MPVTINGSAPTTAQIKQLWDLFVAPLGIAFSSAVPFDGYTSMPQQSVTSALTFTPNTVNAVAGGGSYVRLVSNGSIVPTFPGFIEDGSSHGWGAPNGTVNRVHFWFDGANYYYSIQQEAGLPIVVPVLVSATISASVANQISLLYSVPLDAASVPAASAYTLTSTNGSYSVSSVAVSGYTVTLTTSRAATAGESITVTYTAPSTGQVKSQSAGLAAALTARSVNNNVVAADGITFGSVTGFTVSDAGGYKTYTAAASPAGWGQNANTPTKKLQASPTSDVYLRATLSRTLMVLGLHTDASTVTTIISTPATAYYVWRDAGATAYQWSSGFTSAGATYTGADGDTLRFVRTTANVLRIELSQDGGATWTLLASKTGVSGDLYPRLNASATGSGGQISSVRCNGDAA